MRIRASLRDCADGYLWEDHWTRIEKRKYAAAYYEENYKLRGDRHVVRSNNASSTLPNSTKASYAGPAGTTRSTR
jgi:hypothetical protein